MSGVPGVYFVGLHYLYSMTSATLTGVGRDAERIVKAIESRTSGRAADKARPSRSAVDARLPRSKSELVSS